MILLLFWFLFLLLLLLLLLLLFDFLLLFYIIVLDHFLFSNLSLDNILILDHFVLIEHELQYLLISDLLDLLFLEISGLFQDIALSVMIITSFIIERWNFKTIRFQQPPLVLLMLLTPLLILKVLLQLFLFKHIRLILNHLLILALLLFFDPTIHCLWLLTKNRQISKTITRCFINHCVRWSYETFYLSKPVAIIIPKTLATINRYYLHINHIHILLYIYCICWTVQFHAAPSLSSFYD